MVILEHVELMKEDISCLQKFSFEMTCEPNIIFYLVLLELEKTISLL